MPPVAQRERGRRRRSSLVELLIIVAVALALALVIQAVLSLGAAIFITASLSFLGLGSQPPAADWGLDINANRAYLQAAWWTVVFPGVAVASIVVSANLIADNLKEVSE